MAAPPPPEEEDAEPAGLEAPAGDDVDATDEENEEPDDVAWSVQIWYSWTYACGTLSPCSMSVTHTVSSAGRHMWESGGGGGM